LTKKTAWHEICLCSVSAREIPAEDRCAICAQEETEMQLLTRSYVRFRERKGQSMTEYALIMAAIAVAAYAAYTTLGGKIVTEIGNVSANL
jgi:Flp pilus assembly pilin Flp